MNVLQIVKYGYLKFAFLTVVAVFCLCCSQEDELNDLLPEPKDRPQHIESGIYNPLDFIVISDWGFSGSDIQKNVAQQMENISREYGLQFILTCGDNFQFAGVTATDDPLWNDNFEYVYNDSSLRIPWFPALGNHDYMANPQAQVEYSAVSDRWNMPSRYYTFARNLDSSVSVRFIVLDTPGLLNEYEKIPYGQPFDSISQLKWFSDMLEQAKEKWIIVTGHHPVYSSGMHGDTEGMKRMVKPLLDLYHVDFYICGHDHQFEHARETGVETEFIVTGTGGDARPANPGSRTVFSLSEPGFTFISVSDDRIMLRYITDKGQTAYQFEK